MVFHFIEGYRIRGKKAKQSDLALLAAVLGAVAIFRAWLASDTSFWCDEFVWLGQNGVSLWDTMRRIATMEPAPHIFLDGALMGWLARPLLALGVHPHLAVRMHALLFSLLVPALPFLSTLITPREKRLWLGWSVLSAFILAMAVSSRPYSALIFFASCSLFAGIELARAKRPTRALYIYTGLTGLGALAHIYMMMPLCLFGAYVLFFSKYPVREKLKLLAPLALGAAICAWWFVFYKTNVGWASVGQASFWARVNAAPWFDYFKQITGSFSNPGKRMIVVIPFVALGIRVVVRRDPRLSLYLLACFGAGIVFPVFLDVRHGYFFEPRQVLISFPFWGWFVVQGLEVVLFGKRLKPGQADIALGFLVVFVGIMPLAKIVRNEPPFIDQARYKFREIVRDRLGEKKTLLVLSDCDVAGAELYAGEGMFESYFEGFADRRHMTVKRTPRVREWGTGACSGIPPEKSRDPAVLAAVKKDPKSFVVLAPFNMPRPAALRGLECYDQMNRPCQ